MKYTDIIPTNYMITKIDRKYGATSKEALKMRLLVVAYKMRHTRTYNDCRDYYEKVMNKG
jgi:hypothetical protein